MSGSSSRSSGRLGRPLNSIRLTAWPRRTSSSGTSSPSSASPAAYDATHAAARSGRSSASCRPIWMSPTSSWDRSNPTGWDRQKPKSISVKPGWPARRSRLLGQASPCEARWRDVANSWARTSRWRAAARRPSRRPPKCSATAGWRHVASSCRPGSTVKANRPATKLSMCQGCGSMSARAATARLADRRPSRRAARTLSSGPHGTGSASTASIQMTAVSSGRSSTRRPRGIENPSGSRSRRSEP